MQDVVDAMVAQLPLPTGEESKLVQQYEDKLQACKEEVRPTPRNPRWAPARPWHQLPQRSSTLYSQVVDTKVDLRRRLSWISRRRAARG